MKLVLFLSCILITLKSMGQANLQLKMDSKLIGRADEISFIDSNTFIISTTGNAEMWVNEKSQKQFSIPGYIKGQIIKQNSLLTSGMSEYNLDTEKSDFNLRYIKSVVAVFAPQCQGKEDHFEVNYALPLADQDRLVLALHYRPTRLLNGKDPSPLPKDVIALLALSDASVVSILDSGMFPIFKPTLVDNKLFYGCGSLKCWDITTGKLESRFQFFRLYCYTAYQKGALAFLENGEVWQIQADGTSEKKGVLPFSVRHVQYLAKENCLIVADTKKGLHLVDCHDFSISQSLEMESDVNGLYLSPDKQFVFAPIYLSDYFIKLTW